MLNLTRDEKDILTTCFRQGLYFVLSILFVLSLRLFADVFKAATFKEFGIIENIQLALLTFTAFVFTFEGIKNQKFRALFFFFSSLCVFAFCRELDSFFDKHIPYISWKFCYIFPLIGGIYFFKKLRKIKTAVFLFLKSPAFFMMCSAMFIFIPLAQAIGNRSFISSTLPDANDVHLIRRFIEESGEILAYFILFLSSIEIHFSLLKKEK